MQLMRRKYYCVRLEVSFGEVYFHIHNMHPLRERVQRASGLLIYYYSVR